MKVLDVWLKVYDWMGKVAMSWKLWVFMVLGMEVFTSVGIAVSEGPWHLLWWIPFLLFIDAMIVTEIFRPDDVPD